MKKKSISCIIISAFLLSAFTGCGSEDNMSSHSNLTYQYKDQQRSDNASSMASEEKNICSPSTQGAVDRSNEEYCQIIENSYQIAQENPLSTFSADVDTASYSNIRRMLNENGTVDSDAVRIEEMINYFNYNYPQPENGDPFSVTTEISNCQWNDQSKLVSIGIQGKKIRNDDAVDSNIVFLMDVSGSMYSDDKLPLMIDAFKMLAENLTENDRISIVTYAGSDAVILKGENGSNYNAISNALDELSAGGSTHGSAGINTAYEIAEEYFIEGGNNRVILATDGDLNVGLTTEDELEKLISQKRDSGVYLSVLGFGTGNIKDNKMETLADNGNGNFSYIDSIDEARKVLVEEMSGTLYTIAKDVKLQVEFNPDQVEAYRLVGYENRLMNNSDFYDDKKDAGEIGAGHTVTALYEVVLNDNKHLPLKYQPDQTNDQPSSDELLTVSIKYKDPDNDEGKLIAYPVKKDSFTDFPSENMQFASCVAEFGMLLRNSDYKGTSDYNSIVDTLNSLDCIHKDDYKCELIDLVKIAQKSNSLPLN